MGVHVSKVVKSDVLGYPEQVKTVTLGHIMVSDHDLGTSGMSHRLWSDLVRSDRKRQKCQNGRFWQDCVILTHYM